VGQTAATFSENFENFKPENLAVERCGRSLSCDGLMGLTLRMLLSLVQGRKLEGLSAEHWEIESAHLNKAGWQRNGENSCKVVVFLL
jgi:hypothetical protein